MEGGQEKHGALLNVMGNGNHIFLKLTITPAIYSDAAVYKCTFTYAQNSRGFSDAAVSQKFTPFPGQF